MKYTLLFLTLLLLIPMVRIQFLIHERQALRDGVVQDIARSAAYAQTLTGPLLIVPYTRKLQEQQRLPQKRIEHPKSMAERRKVSEVFNLAPPFTHTREVKNLACFYGAHPQPRRRLKMRSLLCP